MKNTEKLDLLNYALGLSWGLFLSSTIFVSDNVKKSETLWVIAAVILIISISLKYSINKETQKLN